MRDSNSIWDEFIIFYNVNILQTIENGFVQ